MVLGMKTAKKCRYCDEQVEELGTCGDCGATSVCVSCWQISECCKPSDHMEGDQHGQP